MPLLGGALEPLERLILLAEADLKRDPLEAADVRVGFLAELREDLVRVRASSGESIRAREADRDPSSAQNGDSLTQVFRARVLRRW